MRPADAPVRELALALAGLTGETGDLLEAWADRFERVLTKSSFGIAEALALIPYSNPRSAEFCCSSISSRNCFDSRIFGLRVASIRRRLLSVGMRPRHLFVCFLRQRSRRSADTRRRDDEVGFHR